MNDRLDSAITEYRLVPAFKDNAQPILPPASLLYVAQGNYQTFEVADQPLCAYSDSATSCIIVVLLRVWAHRTTVTIAHLDSPACIAAFFQCMRDPSVIRYSIVAQGANPPSNTTAKENARALKLAVKTLSIKDANLQLAAGDPRECNRGMLGVSYVPGQRAIKVSNQPYTLTLTQRDPSCGGQTVYCIMRRQEQPPVQIRDAGIDFTHTELVELAQIALKFQKSANAPETAFTNIVNQSSEEILNSWSSTPAYEAPWFSDQLKMGAAFAISMAPVVQLSAYHLLHHNTSTTSRFTRLSQALLTTSSTVKAR